jgi:polyphenol oxidase
MPFLHSDGLKFFTFTSFQNSGLLQGIFTRNGGVSPQPYHSLNVGGNNGDKRENVVENRQRIFTVIGNPVESLFDVWQVHSSDVICTAVPRPLSSPQQKADAIITHIPGITLFMRFGDCVPIFLFDPQNNVIAIAHAGWQGTVKRIVATVVEKMTQQFGSKPSKIQAGIGPSIGPDHYSIRGDVIELVEANFKGNESSLLIQTDGKTHFDLWAANQLILNEIGVENIEIAGICTACNVQDWFSHRMEDGKTGRFGAVFAIK